MDTDFTDGGEEGQMGEGETILAFPADDGEKSIGARLPSLLLFSFPHPCTSVFIRGKKTATYRIDPRRARGPLTWVGEEFATD